MKTITYEEQLSKPQWQSKRLEILDRDNHQCKNCGKHHSLQVHHRVYYYDKRRNAHILPWEYKNHLLVTLCKDCHESGHKQYQIPVLEIN